MSFAGNIFQDLWQTPQHPHSAGPCDRAAARLLADFPGLSVDVHAAAEWGENPQALVKAKAAIATADIILVNLLFLEEHVQAILPSLEA
ncbi:DUF3479 domain-containing protein, partial [Paracoccaceae bacterium]|nr:DUF3479 domain-containing protein [Paracoccaceae bacterium]